MSVCVCVPGERGPGGLLVGEALGPALQQLSHVTGAGGGAAPGPRGPQSRRAPRPTALLAGAAHGVQRRELELQLHVLAQLGGRRRTRDPF